MTTTIDPFYRGDTVYLSIAVTRGGVEEPLTDTTLWFTMKSDINDSDDDAVIKKDTLTGGITVVNVATGEAEVKLTDEDTDDLTPGMYVWDVQFKAENEDVTTLAIGTVTVKHDITRRKATT